MWRKHVTILVLMLGTFALGSTLALADCNPAPGTVITQKNWQQYKDCFTAGEQYFWQGAGFWKMPADVEIRVGTPHHWVLPQPYVEASEKYGGQTRLVKQADGRYRLENYIAGAAFAPPSGPDKAAEIAANVTYRLGGYVVAGFPDSGGGSAPFYTKDRFNNWSVETVDYLYRQLAYNWEPGIPQTNPDANGAWYTEWLMVETPEQSRYTAVLTIFWQDNLKDEDDYAFVPALRRSLRLSTAARCSPLLGSDMVKDDQRVGWNGGVGKFEGDFLREQPILSLVNMNPQYSGKFPEEYDGLLGWPKPSWGTWETRDVDVIKIHRVPSINPGYCYGQRVMYIDKQYYQTLAEDLYDTNQKLWKVVIVSLASGPFVKFGDQMGFAGILETYWDVQNDHVSYVTSVGRDPKPFAYDEQVPQQYNNTPKYSTPGGLMQLMRPSRTRE
ncbi:MAG: DUF1329 domain-containing protein [Candidatus Binataceae bacterium]